MKRLILSAAFAAVMTAGCGTSKPNPMILSEKDRVDRYKRELDWWFPSTPHKEMMREIGDYEARNGNTKEMERWICHGLDSWHLEPAFKEEAAKKFLADEKNRRKEEADRKAAEWEAGKPERERKAAEEAEKRREERNKNTVCTMDKFNQIRTGMTYDQVTAIVGSRGDVMSQVDLAGYNTVMIGWQNKGFLDGGNMNVTFQNGLVVSKAQAGLR